MRTPLIAGNWKMNGLIAEARELATELKRCIETLNGVEAAVFPPFTALPAVHEVLGESPIALGAQDLHWEEKGAYTGEISSGMLRELGCRYVIIGHSERRHIIGEPNEMVNKKTKAALAGKLVPIVCVGELLEEKRMKVAKEVVEKQVTRALDGLEASDVSGLVVAYEPVWAIGTGLTATPKQAQTTQHFIRNLIARHFGTETSGNVRILYGGSVKPDNVVELMEQEDVDGALVGGASLQADSFAKIVHYQGITA